MRYASFSVLVLPHIELQITSIPEPSRTRVRAEIARLSHRTSGKHLKDELRGFVTLSVEKYRIIYAINRQKNAVEILLVEKRNASLYEKLTQALLKHVP